MWRVLSFAVVVLIAACTSPEITKRYKSYTDENRQDAFPDSVASVSMFSLPLPADRVTVKLTDLSDRGQGELVRVLSEGVDDSSLLLSRIATPTAPQIADEGVDDATTFRRRVVISIRNEGNRPADRIHVARITITPKDAAFRNWDKLKTDYVDIDLGTLSFEQKSAISAELNPNIGGPIGEGLTISGSREETLGEEVKLRQRLVALSGALSPKQAVLEQQGAAGIDLTGNLVVDLEMSASSKATASVDRITGLRRFDGRPSLGRDVFLQRRSLIYPAVASEPLCAKVELDYIIRRVVSGDDTITESDDSVVFVQKQAVAYEPLVTASKLQVGSYVIEHPTERRLVATPTGGTQHRLTFASFGEAQSFLGWLQETSNYRLANATIALGGGAGQPAALTRAVVRDLYVIDTSEHSSDSSTTAAPRSCKDIFESASP